MADAALNGGLSTVKVKPKAYLRCGHVEHRGSNALRRPQGQGFPQNIQYSQYTILCHTREYLIWGGGGVGGLILGGED